MSASSGSAVGSSNGAAPAERRGPRSTSSGPTVVITDLCILKPDPETKELVVTSLHPNVTRKDVIEATGWEIRFADQLATTPEPTAKELEVLRDLKARTDAHHSAAQSGQQ